MNSKFIAIEGPDGAGKSTQIRLISEYLHEKGIETKFVHFPRSSEGIYGELIAKFLRGEFGEVNNVHPQLVALLFAQDRLEFANTIRGWMQEGYFVLVDRYVYSNIAYQCAKTKNPGEKLALRKWILDFEYNHNQIPKPDMSFYLDVPFDFTHKSLNEKRDGEERTYLQGKDDIHEKDLDLQKAVKSEYDSLLAFESDLTRIVCYDENGKMKPVQEIHERIVGLM